MLPGLDPSGAGAQPHPTFRRPRAIAQGWRRSGCGRSPDTELSGKWLGSKKRRQFRLVFCNQRDENIIIICRLSHVKCKTSTPELPSVDEKAVEGKAQADPRKSMSSHITKRLKINDKPFGFGMGPGPSFCGATARFQSQWSMRRYKCKKSQPLSCRIVSFLGMRNKKGKLTKEGKKKKAYSVSSLRASRSCILGAC